MSDYRFGDDYKLNIYPKEAMGYDGLDMDKVESVEIERVDFIRKPDDKSRWFDLFGTPEKAARTIAGIVCDDGGCEGCTLYGANCSYDADVMLRWLRGDVE